jgi:very-short-patch-repair endonuclease
MDVAPENRLAERAAARHGIFTTADAVAVGIGTSTLAHRATTGRYLRLGRSVFAIAGSVPTWRRSVLAAVLVAGPHAAASHRTAAELWELTTRRAPQIEVVVRRWDRVPRPGVRVHESMDLMPKDVAVVDGIPVTSAARTVVDLGAVNRWVVEPALEAGLRAELFTIADVARFVDRVARRGRRGVGVIRPLLDARRHWQASTESALEDLFRRAIDAAGLAQPRPQWVVRDRGGGFVCRADFAYPEHKLLIELDSEAHHVDRIAFRRDRDKQNQAALLGWQTLRYTWWDLTERPESVAAEVREALSSVLA